MQQQEQSTPGKDFSANIEQFQLKINFINNPQSDTSQYEDAISIYVINHEAKYCFQEVFNINNISNQAKAIFFDIPTIFDYIIQNCQDQQRFKITEKGIMICNLVKVKNSVKRQEVFLDMQKKPYVWPEQPEQNQVQLNQQIKILKKQSQHLQKQLLAVSTNSKTFSQKLQSLELIHRQQKINLQQMMIKQEQKWSKEQEQSNNIIRTLIIQQKYMIDSINELKRQLSQQKQQKQEFKQQLRQVRKMIKENKNVGNGHKNFLGHKIEISIDKENQYLSNYILQGNQIEKKSGDQTRFQLLGKEIIGNANRSYFEVRAINLASNGLIIGVVSQTRKGQRHSYDHKECICYDGTGKIFELGKKWPVPVKLQSGQILRVMLDFQQMLIRWYVSYTEIGSALIPENLRNCKFVPYIQLNEVKDKISLNN